MKKHNVAAVILAGGKNSRIKREKSLLKIDNKPLLGNIVSTLSNSFEELIVITSKNEIKAEFPYLTFYNDEFIDCGPLAGIHAAFKNSDADFLFVCACDMPNLNPEIIKKQISKINNSEADIIVPRHSEGIEPLHAIYSRSCLPFIEKQLKNNICSIRSFYEKMRVSYLDLDDEQIKYFYNINTSHDLNSFYNSIHLISKSS